MSSDNTHHDHDEEPVRNSIMSSDSTHHDSDEEPWFEPDKKLLALCPDLDGRNFFAPSPGAHSDDDKFDTALTSCPKNKLRKYTAPPGTDLPWPEKQKIRQQFDHDLRAIQSKLATLTRPLDKRVLDILGDSRLEHDQIEEYLESIGHILRHVRRISHYVCDLRVQNLYDAHDVGLLNKKNNRFGSRTC